MRSPYFFNYQIKWLNNNARIKIWEKSRRIGATYVQSYEDVRDIAKGLYPAVWFSSADESAAKEYILYCAMWAKLFDAGAKELGEVVIDKEHDIKSLSIEFSNGKRINALTSNPKAFRSKGGKVVLDEFAHHKDQLEMWKAAKPSATWGYPIRILSTHNGKSFFAKLIEDVKKGKLDWSVQTTDIFEAVNDGLADKILKRKLSQEERKEWLLKEEQDCNDEKVWLEEYCCLPQDDSDAFLNYELISTCEEEGLLWNQDILSFPWKGKDIGTIDNSRWVKDKIKEFELWLNSIEINGNLFLGYDIGRRKDLSCIWILEKLYNMKITRGVFILENMKFWVQEEFLYSFLRHKKLARACIDETGLGMQLAENAVDKFGQSKVEAINFATGSVRSDMAFSLKKELENRTILIPKDQTIRDDFHSIKKITTSGDKIRLAAETNKKNNSHADLFWASALANHAAGEGYSGNPVVLSRKRKSINENSLLSRFSY